MEIYLPIAEMAVNWLVILGMGGLGGFLAGMLGVGGGFLMTPLLLFYGIPPGIAVGTQACPIAAAAFSGALAQERKHAIDFKMGAVLLFSGIIGSGTGVYLFGLLRRLGQIDLVVSGSYVILLGSIGVLMLSESLRTIRALRRSELLPMAKGAQHTWVHKLPLKMRFRRSRLYISVIPPIFLGLAVGVMTAILGVGGGFLMIPAGIYLLRMPTSIAMGTSQFQTFFVSSVTAVLQAVGNQSVDIVLATLLILGGVIGAQLGFGVGTRLRGEELRAILGAIVVLIGIRVLIGLVIPPDDIYSVITGTQ
jgi:uncharacterized protein